MAIRPASFRSADSASRDPRGGALDPSLICNPLDSDQCVEESAVGGNWVLGGNGTVKRIAKSIERAAQVECTVLICGETGTGKELWARLLHRSGPRRNKAFVPVNCAALTETLAESQLFGHEKGAFTGANGRSLGIFRAAQGGVVFLDEIGEMPETLQAKLRRVLQQREVLPVGATEPVPIDVQVVAATNRNLEDEVEKGRFREDLYYRLNMIELRIPALRERTEDIPLFIDFFARRFADRYRLPEWRPEPNVLAEFCRFPWPGNVRQLEHVIEQGYVLQTDPMLPVLKRPVPGGNGSGRLPCLDLAKLREQAIREALETTRGHKANAAKLLGVHANTMTRLLREIDGGAASEEDDG
jgi:DNA-binding NtrC family response regulator